MLNRIESNTVCLKHEIKVIEHHESTDATYYTISNWMTNKSSNDNVGEVVKF